MLLVQAGITESRIPEEQLSQAFRDGLAQMDRITEFPNTVWSEVYTGYAEQVGRGEITHELPSPALLVDELYDSEETLVERIKEAAEDDKDYAGLTDEMIAQADMTSPAKYDLDAFAARRTLIAAKLGSRATLAQVLYMPDDQRYGSYGQVTFATNDFTTDLHERANSPDLPEGVFGFGPMLMERPSKYSYRTYDFRVGGDVMRYDWDGHYYDGYLKWIGDDGLPYVTSAAVYSETIRLGEADKPNYLKEQLPLPSADEFVAQPVVSNDELQIIIDALRYSLPYVGALNDSNSFPPNILPPT
jgi:hypothetical protein